MVMKKINRNERFMLRGSLRKNGFDRWRLVTNAISCVTGEEKTFFIEFYIVNPLLSPDECVMGFKNRCEPSPEELQYALAGTESAKNIAQEKYVSPSFLMIKAGCLSGRCVQINSYFPFSSIDFGSGEYILSVKDLSERVCMLSDDCSCGEVSVTEQELVRKPELLGNAGSMSWNLKFNKVISFRPDYRTSDICWSVNGGRTDFSGTIVLNEEEFIVNPRKSFGFCDKNWGRDFAVPYFHLSSSNLLSRISGKNLLSSCFALQGIFGSKIDALISIEDHNYEFRADSGKKYSVEYDFTELPSDSADRKLHWSVSVHNTKYVVDIDIFCFSSSLLVRDFECPEGGRSLMKILSGGKGTGEIRIYKYVKKNLELLEHAEIFDCLCEFGNKEYPL